MDCKEQFVWEELGRRTGTSIQCTEKERREEVNSRPYLVSSLYHSKSGVGTADASHRSKACRPVAASLLLDSVMVGGSAGRKHVVNPHTSRWNKTGKLCQGCLPHANCLGYWRSMAAVCCGPCSPFLLCRTLLFEPFLTDNISNTPYTCFSSALLNKFLS